MIGVARITSCKIPGKLNAWIDGVEGGRELINPECAKPGEDRVVHYATDMRYAAVIRNCDLIEVKDRAAYILMEDDAPVLIKFERDKIEAILNDKLENGADGSRYYIKGLALDNA